MRSLFGHENWKPGPCCCSWFLNSSSIPTACQVLSSAFRLPMTPGTNLPLFFLLFNIAFESFSIFSAIPPQYLLLSLYLSIFLLLNSNALNISCSTYVFFLLLSSNFLSSSSPLNACILSQLR